MSNIPTTKIELLPHEKIRIDNEINRDLTRQIESLAATYKIKGMLLIYTEVNMEGARAIKHFMTDEEAVYNVEAFKANLINRNLP